MVLKNVLTVLKPNVLRLEASIDRNYSNNHGELYLVFTPLAHGPIHKIPPDTTIKQRRKIFTEGCHALSYLHDEMGYMHRDVKPPNLLFHYDDTGSIQLILSDFGHTTESKVCTDHTAGTIQFLAPEIISIKTDHRRLGKVPSGKSYDKSVDIWAFGLSVIHLFTGGWYLSLIDQHHGVTLAAHQGILDRLSLFDDSLPSDVRTLVIAMLAWNPEDRPQAKNLRERCAEMGGGEEAETTSGKRPRADSSG